MWNWLFRNSVSYLSWQEYLEVVNFRGSFLSMNEAVRKMLKRI